MINFPFGTNGKFIILRCPNTLAHYGNLDRCRVFQLRIDSTFGGDLLSRETNRRMQKLFPFWKWRKDMKM